LNYYLTLEAPWQWAMINPKGELVDHGTFEEFEQIKIPKQVTKVIGVVPGEFVTTRDVMVPGRRRSNVEAALPYALEESLTEEVEALHFTLLRWQAGQAATVAIVSRTKLSQWIDHFSEIGVALDQAVPGYLLVPLYGDETLTVCPLPAGPMYIRTGEFAGFAIEQDFFPYWLESEDLEGKSLAVTDVQLATSLSSQSEFKVSHWEIGSHIGDWLKMSAEVEPLGGLSLLHGEFLPAHRSRNFRPIKIAVACCVVALVMMSLSMVREMQQLRKEEKQIDSDMVTLFNKHFPNEPYLGRPKFQVESLLGQQQGGGQNEFQQLLNVTSEVLIVNGGEIEEINFRDRSLTVLCSVKGLSVLDRIQQSLQQQPGVTAELLSSGARDNEITGRFRVTRG
jgi:general secretion pathway protein L